MVEVTKLVIIISILLLSLILLMTFFAGETEEGYGLKGKETKVIIKDIPPQELPPVYCKKPLGGGY